MTAYTQRWADLSFDGPILQNGNLGYREAKKVFQPIAGKGYQSKSISAGKNCENGQNYFTNDKTVGFPNSRELTAISIDWVTIRSSLCGDFSPKTKTDINTWSWLNVQSGCWKNSIITSLNETSTFCQRKR